MKYCNKQSISSGRTLHYIKLFEGFSDKIKEDLYDILIELVDDKFDIKVDESDGNYEVEIKKLGLQGLSFECSQFLFRYEEVSEYLKTINEYMNEVIYDIKYSNDVIFQKRDTMSKKIECTWNRFILLEEKFVNRDSINRINSDNNKFTYIKLIFIKRQR
jgi:uncharacterized UPF0160 family protein